MTNVQNNSSIYLMSLLAADITKSDYSAETAAYVEETNFLSFGIKLYNSREKPIIHEKKIKQNSNSKNSSLNTIKWLCKSYLFFEYHV